MKVTDLFEALNPEKIDSEHRRLSTYAVLDGVKNPMLWSDLEEGVLRYDMLFEEEALRRSLKSVAPYLVELEFTEKGGAAQTSKLLRNHKENSAIFITSPFEFESMLERAKEIFYIQNDSGEKGYLRFYDPPIFFALMQQSEKVKLELLRGIYSYWCIDTDDKERLIQYFYTQKGFAQKFFTIKTEETAP